MKVAVIGVGRIGLLHAQLLAGRPEVSEIVVQDIDQDRAGEAAAIIGRASAVATIEEALERAEAVVVAASTHAHPGLVRAAVDHGLPVFCEKPLALELAETIDLVEHVERARGTVQVGFQRRFDPAYVEARRLLTSGELGRLYLVRLIAHDFSPPPDAYIPISGGLFRDSSIHDFDALRWFTGAEVDEVYAIGAVRGFEVFAQNDDVDTAVATLRMSDGSLAVLSQTRHDPRGYDVRMEAVGSRDSVTVGLSDRTPLRSLEAAGPTFPGPAWESFLTRFATAYREELIAFLRVARREIPSPCTARDGLEAMRISVAATRSRAEHRPISLFELT